MSKYEKEYNIKKLKVFDFNALDYRTEDLYELIINSINLSDGVYAYRALNHLLVQNDFIKWMKEENSLMTFKEISVEFPLHNKLHKFIPKNNENVYFVELQKNNREKFLEHYKISIADIKNSIRMKSIERYSDKKLFIDDPLYDQYDFIFTKEDQVILWTDIHSFLFFITDVYHDKVKNLNSY